MRSMVEGKTAAPENSSGTTRRVASPGVIGKPMGLRYAGRQGGALFKAC